MRFGGIASGLDTEQMVRDLMKAERMPMDKLVQQREWLNMQQDAYREMNTAFTSFRSSYDNLRLQGTFNAYQATSTHDSRVTASASGSAVPGNYSLQVDKLAEVARLNSENSIRIDGERVTSSDRILAEGEAETQFTLRVPSGSGDEDYIEAVIEVTEEDTFASIARKMERAVGPDNEALGVRASFDNTTGRFFLSTREMGEDQGISLVEAEGSTFVQERIMGRTEPDAGGAEFTATGSNGSIIFNGIKIDDLTSNNVTVQGINLDLMRADRTGEEEITIRVSSNPDELMETIMSFVEDYNELIGEVQGKLNEPRHRDFPPLTEEQRSAMSEREIELWEEKAHSGLLRGDNILSSSLQSMRRALLDPVQGIGDGEINQLSQIGINTGNYSFGGQLFVDEDKLREAILERPDEVRNLFTQSAGADVDESESYAHQGLGHKLYQNLNQTVNRLREQAGRPSTNPGADQSSIGRDISRVEDRITQFEYRLQQTEDRYWRQFTALETAMHEMNNQSAWMMQNMFGGMGGM